ncbi:efflux RND transporter permease subunit [Desulfonema magnum]|uniref:Acriflavin resistance protein n=1 Tax=Desulfonema magnum TaxID=45655 RepID=A0A975BTG8_9BACT|nr:efflux RND transporter permease subunit [Desulfonema magnum]QTA91341.1 Acriflavin resistance protein [Desulfonema magnum]
MIRFFANHPTAANLLALIFIVMGVFSLSSLRRETLPDHSADQVEVRVVYPGATAEDVEQAICQRIEDVVDGVNYVEEVRSEAREGMGSVVIEMQEGKDFRQFIEDIKTEVEAIDDFPEQAEIPVIRELGRTDQVISIAVTGPMSPRDLKAYCEDLKTRLQMEDEISLVTIQGFSDHQIRIQIPGQTLMQYGLSVTDIADVISRQSVDLPAGTIETSAQEILIRFTDERRSPREFESLVVVAGASGAEIRLGDIAEISDVFELDEEKIIFNGQRAGLLQITKTKSEDALKIVDALSLFLEKEEKLKPPAVQFTLTQDVSSIVRDRLLLLVRNGWQGLILVFLTMWLFFSFKFSFWVAMGLPVSFLGAFFFIPHINYSLNMLTMVGLLIALGLLMDDAIVIAENIATHLRKGKSAIRAAIDGTGEVKVGVLSSFLTTLCIFGPISFTEGAIGKVLKVMPVVLILVLAVSIVEAFCILPNHLAHSLKHYDPDSQGRLRRRFDGAVEWMRENILGRVVDFAVGWRYLFVGLTVAAFILSVGMIISGNLKFQAFPDIDGDVIEARVLMPQGTPLTRTEAVVKRITTALEKVNTEFTPLQPGQESLVKNVSVRYNKNMDAYESGPHVVTINADLLKAENRNARVDDVLNKWRKNIGDIPDIIFMKFTEPAIGPAGLPIEISVKGDNLEELKAAALEMQSWFSQFEGVFDVFDDLRPGKPEMRIRMREGAAGMGLNAQMLATQLRTAYYGKTVNEIQVGDESYEIDVRLRDEDQNTLADLEYFHVTLPGGKQVPIGSAAILESGRGYARIARVDGQRAVTVQGNIDPHMVNAAEIIRMFKTEFLPDFEKQYPLVRVDIEGESKESGKTSASMRRGFLIGLIGVFVLLSFQFRSYVEPFVVMIAIPFALIGVVWGHILMGLELCMPSMMGFISLAGIVVNDSILLVEFLKTRRREGQAIPDAARHASRERFRAVMLTSLTTIAGLLPLLSERSLQAQILIPLATSIVFGLLASTVLVLIVVPSLYAILGDLGLASEVEHE